MPLKPIENFPAGGVSSRDNPLAYPPDRYLMLKNFWPQVGGELRLRDGYSLYATGLQPGVPVHSIVGIVGPGPDYKRLIVFWQEKTPYLLDPDGRTITTPTIRGTPIQSSSRFCYFSTGRHLHAYNGTDAKFFDGLVWRDIGLPRLTKAEADAVVVAEGLASISTADAAAVTVADASGGGWLRNDKYGEFVYLAMFDQTTDEIAGSTIPLGSGSRVKVSAGHKINLSGLPVPANANVVKIPLLTGDGTTVGTPILDLTAFVHPTNLAFTSLDTTTVQAHCNSEPHLLTTGDIIGFSIPSDSDTPPRPGPFTVTVIDALNFTFKVKDGESDSYATFTECFRILKYSNGATTGSINSFTYILTGMISDVMAKENVGLAASTIGGVQPGYQFYMSIRNKVTQHVGNRRAIGQRLNNSSRTNVLITGYPNVALVDDEWELLIGRTGDGAELPYAIIDESGDYIVAENGTRTLIVHQDSVSLVRSSNVVTGVLTFPGIVGFTPPSIPIGSIVTVSGSSGAQFDGTFAVDTSVTAFSLSEWTITLTWIQSGLDQSSSASVDAFTSGLGSTTIRASKIDGDTELPERNFPPPGTLDYNDQVFPDPPVSGTFKCAWVESDHCCGTLEGSPFVFRSGSAQDVREGKFVGLSEQAWSPVDVETFPTAAPVVCGQGYAETSIVYSKEDSAVLSELASELGWQGPWNIGSAGQFAYTKGWKSLPFVLTGEKQLATAGADGPVPISDEYEAALLSKIGDQYLGDSEMVYVRKPHKRVEVLRINAKDKDGKPITIVHDFNLRDTRSPYGQAYEEELIGEATESLQISFSTTSLTRQNGIVTFTKLFTVPLFFSLEVGDSAVVTGGSSFDGRFKITSVESVGFPPPSQNHQLTVKWEQEGIDETGVADLFLYHPGAFPTIAVVRGENDIPQVLAGSANGNIYLLYDGISDAGEFFTGEALGLKYIGPQRSGVKYLSWYGDREAKFFIAKKLTTTADTGEMSAICDNPDVPVAEVQDDEGSNHWQAAITDDIEMRHAYVWIKLTGRATSLVPNPDDPNNPIEVPNTMEPNDPPHMPVETYGRVLMVTPEVGASNPR